MSTRFSSLESPFLNGEVLLGKSAQPPEPAYAFEEEDTELDDEWSFEELEGSGEASPLDVLSRSELKAVRITSTFETGRAGSFGGLTGNFDGQGVSFGLMNFAWKAGSLVTLLKEFATQHPVSFAEVFGPDAARLQEVLFATKPDPKKPARQIRDLDRQMQFALAMNDPRNRIRKPWSDYFAALEVNPHFRRIQVKAVRAAAKRARYWCDYFELRSERGFAFMFDLVSSHGGAWLNAPKFKGQRRTLLRAMLDAKKKRVGRDELTEREKLEVIANMIADVSSARFRDLVRIRKLWFVNGSGEVHGTSYDLARDFGVTDAPPVFDREGPEPPSFEAEDEGEDLEQWTHGELEDEEEELQFTPAEHETEEEDFAAVDFDPEHTFLDEEESDFEDGADAGTESQEAPVVSYDARIVSNKPRTEKTPAEIALVVDRWDTPSRGVRLKVYECDVREAGRSDAVVARDVQMAEFTLDIAANKTVTNIKWANAALEKSYKATSRPDLVLWVGTKAFPLWIPREDILEEGTAVEIGFVLEDAQGHRVERMSVPLGQVVTVAIPDYLRDLLTIPGRFDDPRREPAVDMDGTRFDEFLRGQNRRACIVRWLETHPALQEAANEPDADLRTTDILKAYFVVHDVGVSASLTDRRYRANQPATKKNAVHGFLNRGGYFAATHDFSKNRQGTVYEFLSKKGLRHINGRTINIETVPDIEPDVADRADGSRGLPSNPDRYASIGYRRRGKTVTYYKWTRAAFDVLADLYIFASMRARHLLTITVHKEMDRNLARSVIWREYSAAEMRAGTGKHWETARSSPSNYHGDPYGFDMQALYDVITRKLNALGGKQMPAGARYGVHPRRVCRADGQDITNGSNHLHEFPHQSNPVISIDTTMKKSGWWNP